MPRPSRRRHTRYDESSSDEDNCDVSGNNYNDASGNYDASGNHLCRDGRDGQDGLDGQDGRDGRDGRPGREGPRGPRGCHGATGWTGDTGYTGETGPMGETGSQGDTGAQGALGPVGPVGPVGPRGATGAQGLMGWTGAQGLQGVKGDTGTQGSTGPMFAQTFLHVDSVTEQVLAAEQAVSFDSAAVVYGGIAHVANTPDMYIWQTGFYHVYFNVYHLEACQITSFLNGVPLDGTVTGSPTGSSQNSSTFIIYISPSDVLVTPTLLSPTGFAAKLNLVNHSSYVPLIHLDLASGSGSVPNQINATMTIFRLA